jgi:V/A-type H+-transporting ATPase subunit E
MTGIEKITGRIAADAQAEIDTVLAEAQSQADGITAKYEAQARQEYENLKRRGESAAQEREKNLHSSAQMEARKLMLSAKQEMLDAAFQKAQEQLCGLDDEKMTQLLAALAVKASTTGREEVILSAGVRERLGEAVVKKANADGGLNLTLSQEAGAFEGGLLLKNGAVEINGTFDTLVRLVRGDMAGEVAKVLFD